MRNPPLLQAAAFCLLTIGVTNPAFAADQTAHVGAPSDSNLRYIGRWDKSDPAAYHSYWGGAYLRARFTGTLIVISGGTAAGGPDFLVSVDEEPLQAVAALSARPLKLGIHTLLMGAVGQNHENIFQGLHLSPGGVTLPVPARPLIEFIGDSITTGGGQTLPSTVNYAWESAEMLGADHTQIAFSGRALTTGYGCGGDKIGLDTEYFLLKNFNHRQDKPPVPYRFTYTPQVIVINLGQNDQCGREPAAVMTASYKYFVQKLRAKFPDAQIVALRPFGGAFEKSIHRAVTALTAAGGSRMSYVDTTGWLEKADFVDGIHPTEAGHRKVAEHLAPLLHLPIQTVTVGDPKAPEKLAAALQDAYQNGARHIVIKPGVYLLPNVGHSAFELDDWQDAAISAYGTTLILTDLAWGHNAFELSRCSRVTVQGGTLSQNQITSYQGRVVAVGTGADGKATCDWKPDTGYPVPPIGSTKFPGAANVVDARTRRLKIGDGDFYDLPMKSLGNGIYRLMFNRNELHFGVGDWLVGLYGDAPFKISLDNCRDCTIKDVTMMRNGFANIREDGGGGNHILHCIWALGPRPGNATEYPLVTNSADGLHSTGASPGPDIENCIFQGIFLDDCVAVHGSFQTIQSVSGAVLIVKNGGARLQVGDPARISDEKGFFGEGIVTALRDNGDKTMTVTLGKGLGVPVGAKLSNPHFNGVGTRIIGCTLGNTRSRGILLKCDQALVQNNTIVGCGMAATSLGPEYYWNEADYVQNVTISGNTLRGNGGATYGGAAIIVHGNGAMGNKNIVIKNNRLSSNLQGDVQIEWTENVTLSSNVFTGAAYWPDFMAMKSPLSLSNCKTVALHGNSVVNAKVDRPALVEIGANVSGLQNDALKGPSPVAPSTPLP